MESPRLDEATTTADSLYSEAQSLVLLTIPKILAPLSLLGSSLIIYVVVVEERGLRTIKKSYDRIILALSLCDAVASLSLTVFGPWAIPEQASALVLGARAPNFIICDVAGFLAHFTMGSILYTAALMVHFIFLIKLEWKPERIAKRVEPLLHFFVLAPMLSTGIVATMRGYMNPMAPLPGICYVTAFPPICEFSSDVDCLRGKGSLSFARAFAAMPFFTLMTVFVAMRFLLIKVRTTEERIARYQFAAAPPATNSASTTRSLPGSSERTRRITQRGSLERTRRTAQRGLAYIAAFMVSYMPPAICIYIITTRPIKSQNALFALSLSIVAFLPCQGIFNAIIYLHPKWKELSKEGGRLHWLARGFSWVSSLLFCLSSSWWCPSSFCVCDKNGGGANPPVNSMTLGGAMPSQTTGGEGCPAPQEKRRGCFGFFHASHYRSNSRPGTPCTSDNTTSSMMQHSTTTVRRDEEDLFQQEVQEHQPAIAEEDGTYIMPDKINDEVAMVATRMLLETMTPRPAVCPSVDHDIVVNHEEDAGVVPPIIVTTATADVATNQDHSLSGRLT